MKVTELQTLERFDCTSGGASWCQGCYTMTRDEDGDYVRFDDVAKLIEAKVLAGLAAQAVPAPVAVSEGLSDERQKPKGWQCYFCKFDGLDNQQYNQFCSNCRVHR